MTNFFSILIVVLLILNINNKNASKDIYTNTKDKLQKLKKRLQKKYKE